MAKLFFRYAAMNAGKSTALLQVAHNYEERGMQVRLFTAAFDDRSGHGVIASRLGLAREADTFGPDTAFERAHFAGVLCVKSDDTVRGVSLDLLRCQLNGSEEVPVDARGGERHAFAGNPDSDPLPPFVVDDEQSRSFREPAADLDRQLWIGIDDLLQSREHGPSGDVVCLWLIDPAVDLSGPATGLRIFRGDRGKEKNPLVTFDPVGAPSVTHRREHAETQQEQTREAEETGAGHGRGKKCQVIEAKWVFADCLRSTEAQRPFPEKRRT